jgi:hypothetical protein
MDLANNKEVVRKVSYGQIFRSTFSLTTFVAAICCISCKGGSSVSTQARNSGLVAAPGTNQSSAARISPANSLNASQSSPVSSETGAQSDREGAGGNTNTTNPVADTFQAVGMNGASGENDNSFASLPSDPSDSSEGNDDLSGGTNVASDSSGNSFAALPGDSAGLTSQGGDSGLSSSDLEVFTTVPSAPDSTPNNEDSGSEPDTRGSSNNYSDLSPAALLASSNSNSGPPPAGLGAAGAGSSSNAPPKTIQNPEPSSIVLISVGLAALVLSRLRKRRLGLKLS